MFENEDNEYEMTEIEKWYDDNYGYFRRESKTELGITFDISLFYTGVYRPAMQELAPSIRKLMLRQYPIIRTECRPLVLDYIDNTVMQAGHRFLMNLYVLVQDQKEGVDLREKYPSFESWIDFYARPPKAPEPDYSFFEKYPALAVNLSREQMKEIADEIWKEESEHFYERERLKTEYYNIVQPIVLKYYRALEDLDTDGWIIYSVQIREDYEDYKYRCEHLDTFIEYEFDEEDINLGHQEFMEKFSIKYNQKLEKKRASADSE